MITVPHRRKHFRGNGHIAESVILDFADNHGSTSWQFFRQIDFWFEGSKILVAPSDGVAGATTFLGVTYKPVQSFDTLTGKIGSQGNRGWASAAGSVTNQRIYFKFNTPILFDTIIVNNGHESGGFTNTGVNNTKIYTTEDTGLPSIVYGSAIPGGVKIYDGVIREHIASNVEDPETLVLI